MTKIVNINLSFDTQITIELKCFKLSCATKRIFHATSEFNVTANYATMYNVMVSFQHNNPYVMAMFNDGTKAYDHNT